MTTVKAFETSLMNSEPPQGLTVLLQALWYDAKGNWTKAHSLVDNLSGSKAAAIHAYLHRVEGDNGNANYWYQRAGRKMPDSSLKEEWKQLAEELLASE